MSKKKLSPTEAAMVIEAGGDKKLILEATEQEDPSLVQTMFNHPELVEIHEMPKPGSKNKKEK